LNTSGEQRLEGEGLDQGWGKSQAGERVPGWGKNPRLLALQATKAGVRGLRMRIINSMDLDFGRLPFEKHSVVCKLSPVQLPCD